jgi:hypothetical protein
MKSVKWIETFEVFGKDMTVGYKNLVNTRKKRNNIQSRMFQTFWDFISQENSK